MVNNISNIQTQQLYSLLQERLQSGASVTVQVTSHSMWPLLSAGDNIIIVQTSTNQLQPGDIITFLTDQGLLTHRFWGFVPQQEPLHLLTRGDQPRSFDPPTAATHLLGRVVACQRRSRLLRLDVGAGRWLDRQLRRLAAWVHQGSVATLKSDSKVAHLQSTGHSVIQKRSIHKGVYIIAAGITAVVHALASTPISETQ